MKRRAISLLLAIALIFTLVPCIQMNTYAATYTHIDFSSEVYKSGIGQHRKSDCAIASIATMEAYVRGITDECQKENVYNAVYSCNSYSVAAKWDTLGYKKTTNFSLNSLYNYLISQGPVIIHRDKSDTVSGHYSVVCGYTGSTTQLEENGFIVLNVSSKTSEEPYDPYVQLKDLTSWKKGRNLDQIVYRSSGISDYYLNDSNISTEIPNSPAKPSVSINGTKVKIQWNDVANETSYDVYLVQSPWGWEDIKYSKSVSANTTSCTFSNVAPGEYCAFIISRPNANNVQSPWASFSVLEETCTSHTKGDYLWYEAGHPHYKYWTCANCGVTFTDGTTTYVSSCVSCNPEAGKPFYAWVTGTNGALAINDAPASSPNNSNQLGRIPEGCMCIVYPDKAKGNWWWVEYNGVTGYSYSKYLTTSHTHKYSETVTAPKCTKQGFTTYACSCGYSYTGNFTEAIGHDWQLTSEAYPPTCESHAFWSYNCARSGCLDCMVRIFVPLGHDYNDYIVASYPNQNTSGEICGSCSRCESTDAIVIPNLNTTDYTYEVILQPSCNSNGYGRYTWNETAYGLFTFDVELQKLTHNYAATIMNPTCINQGYTIHSCAYCGDSYIDNYVDALGHAWDEGTVTKWPTEYEEGEMTYTCTRCSETKTESIPKGDHIHCYSITETVDATCTERGYAVGICEVCGDKTAEYNVVEALGHDWDTGVFVIYPTETEPGKRYFTCRRCGDYFVEIVPPYGNHEYGYCPTMMFTDAPGWTNWAHVGVDYVVEHGLFNGTSATTFSPDNPMTRAMLVTVLWRYAGEPLEGENSFTDVLDGQWYTEAVSWAAHNGIVGGVGNGKFDPNGNITREQMAAILYRYCNSLGIDTTKRADLSSFPDGNKVSAWAIDALSWANAEGLINGTQSGSSVYLDPQGNATRAQVATILMRFIESVVK